jgi:hypothetical protein
MLRTLLANELRFLTFRRVSPAVRESWVAFLMFGLVMSWLAGVGRYWDNPRAHVWQHLGLGSVVYVFVLALVLWALIAPLRPQHWTYKNVLLFVTMTSPPALIYAIPVEKFMSLDAAQSTNATFLAVVSVWRVALYAAFLRGAGKLGRGAAVVATLLPLVLIVVALAVLNLEHVVFDMMGGMRPEQRSANDAAYDIVLMLSILSVYAAPVLFMAYIVLALRATPGPHSVGE